MTTVVNIRTHGKKADVYIGRPGPWGNPFSIGKDGTREQVIAAYRKYLWATIQRDPTMIEALAQLDGKTLACHCAPKPCHGDVLVRASAWAVTQLLAERGIPDAG